MVNRILIFILLATIAKATDLTPYNFGALGNTRGSHSITWYAQRLELLSHYRNLNAAVFDSIKDTAEAEGKHFLAGFYASDQEINMIEYDTTMSYNTRLLDTASCWFYILIKRYFDSIGVDVDSSVIHWDDTDWQTVNDGRGDGRTRAVHRADTLLHRKTRVSYQTFDNGVVSPADYFYPAGYCWLANGKNINTRKAIAYALRRRLFDPVIRQAVEGGSYGPMTYIYMDNQYRNAGYLGSYWTIDTSYGGPTSGPDFQEGYTNVNIESGGATYHDNSTLPIDSTLMAVLDSTADANGYDSVETFANVDWSDPTGALSLCGYVSGIFLEGPMQPDRYASFWNNQWQIIAGLINDHPTTMSCWYLFGNFSSYFADGLDRELMAHYAFFLMAQNYYQNKYWSYYMIDGNMDFSSYGGTWRDIYEVDLGHPQPDTPMTVYYAGNGWYGATPYNWVKQRVYLTGTDTTGIVLFRSAASTSYDWDDDSVAVTLPMTCYEIDVNADTGVIPVTTAYMKPYQGRIYVPQSALTTNQSPVIDSIIPDTGTQGQYGTIYTSYADDHNIDSLVVFLIAPNASRDTVVSKDFTPDKASPGDTTISYLWNQSGTYEIHVVVVDDSAATTRDSIDCVVSSAASGATANEYKGILGKGIKP